MDGVLGWTQRQANALTALRPAKEKSKGHVQVDNRNVVCCSWHYIVLLEVRTGCDVLYMPATFLCLLLLNCNELIAVPWTPCVLMLGFYVSDSDRSLILLFFLTLNRSELVWGGGPSQYSRRAYPRRLFQSRLGRWPSPHFHPTTAAVQGRSSLCPPP
jgi:hypothetical protein